MRAEMLVAGLCVTLGTAAGALDLEALKAQGAIRVIVAADEAPETFALQPATDAGFEVDTNRVIILGADGTEEEIPLQLKSGIAQVICDRVANALKARNER